MANKSMIEADIVVLGAGLIGLTAAISFAQQGRKVVLVDSQKKPAITAENDVWDARIYALTPATIDWLTLIGVWQHINSSRIAAIDGMQLWPPGDNPVESMPLDLMAGDADIIALGCIIENRNLLSALMQQADALAIQWIHTDFEQLDYLDSLDHLNNKVQLHLNNHDTASADLLVAADGVHSSIRQLLALPTQDKDFEQTAIVANFLANKPHANIARQWFLPHETLALLPLPGQNVSMVWSLPNRFAADLLALTAEELALRVAAASKFALGELQLTGQVLSFPLRQITAKQIIAERVVLIGDAAHQIHPMAGQGLNLGLRDIATLAALVEKAHALQDIGEANFLRQYERSRKTDITTMNILTSGLDTVFALSGVASRITGLGLRQLNTQTALKKWLIQQATH